MSTQVKLPEIGEGVTEGELIRWLVKVGDVVKVDQSIAEVMTDKATVEVPTPTAGTVKALKAKEGDVIKVEQVMIELEATSGGTSTAAGASAHPAAATAATKTPPPSTHSKTTPSAPAAASFSKPSSSPATASSAGGATQMLPPADLDVLATPATRRLAREMNVDINTLTGTGLAGRVTREDVMHNQSGITVAAPTKAPGAAIPRLAYQGPAGAIEERVALRGIRKKIAENLQQAKHIIPHFTLMDEANVDQLVQLRESLKGLAETE